MNFFQHKDLGIHLLQLSPKVVKHSVYREVGRAVDLSAPLQRGVQVICTAKYADDLVLLAEGEAVL